MQRVGINKVQRVFYQRRLPYGVALDKATLCLQHTDRELFHLNLKHSREISRSSIINFMGINNLTNEKIRLVLAEKVRLKEILIGLEIGPKTVIEFMHMIDTELPMIMLELQQIEMRQQIRLQTSGLTFFYEDDPTVIHRIAYMGV